VSGLATSRPILLLLSSLLFVSLTLLTGHILHLLLRRPSTKRAILKPRTLSLLDAFDSDWDEDWDGGVVIIGGGGALIYDVVIGAIQTFATVANRFTYSRDKLLASLPPIVGVIVFALGVRFILGIAVLGSLSFLSLLLSLSLFAPLQLANGFRGAGLFNFGRRNRTRGDGTAIGQIMIIIFVLIGAANTLVQVYGAVEAMTQRLLRYVETQILEVNPEERRRAQRDRARRRDRWYMRWWRENRWATRQGWEEIGIRLRIMAQNGLGPVWDRVFGHPHEHLELEQ
jgi:hypothetical protein